MKNKLGFGKFEIIAVILLLLVISSILLLNILKRSFYWRTNIMRKDSIVFSKIVASNISSFHNSNIVYLQEVIDAGLINKIKNPVGDGYCSNSESFVHVLNNNFYVTLKCGNLLIDNVDTASEKINIYRVSEWDFNKGENDSEERVLYNCFDNKKDVFDFYTDKYYFIYMISKKYHSSVSSIEDISSCEVVSKNFYRTKMRIT